MATSETTPAAMAIEETSDLGFIKATLIRMEQRLDELVAARTIKDWYSTEEFARMVDREDFTVREWARRGRIRAKKRNSGRGPHAEWVVSHDELLRYRREGLLPDVSRRPA
jgi:Helix-turn-helix domain